MKADNYAPLKNLDRDFPNPNLTFDNPGGGL